MSPSTKKPEITRHAEFVLPEDTNNRGTMYGGRVLERMDKLAAITALKHARKQAVTASFDSTDFHEPISQGDLVEMESRVIYTGKTSMVIQIEVWSESPFIENRSLKTRGFIVFVALDENNTPTEVPKLALSTQKDKDLWEIGKKIKETLTARRSQN